MNNRERASAWTPERRAAQSEKMRQARPVDAKRNPDKPWGGKPQRLSDDDIRLIHALARERDELRAEHKRAKDRVADLWDKIQSLSNAEIGKKFDVTESTISHALVSVRGNKVA